MVLQCWLPYWTLWSGTVVLNKTKPTLSIIDLPVDDANYPLPVSVGCGGQKDLLYKQIARQSTLPGCRAMVFYGGNDDTGYSGPN
ncbi:hypothetical protein CARN8_3700001 [mine drainage metagenome]|uniref:Uncharacterized protein n=1 Tax=mine drainage metagenome TaxID=410659 RepID=A0A3P3ZPS6_9ZZZZ